MSALALVVSMSGITPAEAVRTVKHALNADAVNGIKASRKPKANHLVPLGANAKLPSSVLPGGGPRGQRGPMGPQGSAGAPGTPGASGVTMVRLVNGAPLRLPLTAGTEAEVARLDNLPAGNWLLMWTATADNGGASVGTWCKLRIGTTDFAAADAQLGTAPDAASAAVITASGSTSQSAPFSVAMRCYQTGGLGAPGVGIDSQHLIAIRADSLEVSGGG
jgi:hypothetical protein